MGARVRTARRATRGFTLIEIIVVVALIAVLTAIIASVISGGLGSSRVRAASKDLVAALRSTRAMAVVERESQVLVLDVERRAYKAPGRDWVELPEDMEMSMLTAAEEQLDEGQGQIRFFPDGSSTGGNIELIRGEAVWRIEIGWLTGEVRMNPEANR
ncbi:GspH/FimT family pseudopilin [Pseudomarimonas salicorniae]|uniref:Type II secretion system protein H n=1 Tax=Pseudomarimonas salicorniae TaxID=2933270 RepID=A0ABT0GJ45_9GAMM|nr:GspH/FimT family pseudopilin [Lysobacter sp. CAU 1642]MCK7594575.1 GspH/FimT family pseudopilin [Lysobacter sp. CAU 1642]